MDPVLAARLQKQRDKEEHAEITVPTSKPAASPESPTASSESPKAISRMAARMQAAGLRAGGKLGFDESTGEINSRKAQAGPTPSVAVDPVLAARLARQLRKQETGESSVEDVGLERRQHQRGESDNSELSRRLSKQRVRIGELLEGESTRRAMTLNPCKEDGHEGIVGQGEGSNQGFRKDGTAQAVDALRVVDTCLDNTRSSPLQLCTMGLFGFIWGIVTQIAVMFLIAATWMLWFVGTTQCEGVKNLLVLGAALCANGFLYRQLPLDRIPDCIPRIGKLDDMMAAFIAATGVVSMLVGGCLNLGLVF